VERIFPYAGSSTRGGYVSLEDRCYEDPKNRTYRQLLGKKAEASTAIVRDPAGSVREVLKATNATQLLRDAGHDWAKEKKKPAAPASTKRSEGQERYAAGTSDAELKDKAHETALTAAAPKVVDAVKASGGIVKTLQLVAEDYATRITNAVAGKKGAPTHKQLLARAKSADSRELAQLVMECYLMDAMDMGEDHLVEQACEAFGVDVKALEKDVFEQLKAERDKPKSAAAADSKGGSVRKSAKAKGPLARKGKKASKTGRGKAA
jgi:hypothetical protein